MKKTIIAATLVLFTLSTAASAFEIPSTDGLDVQQLMGKGKGKRSQRAQQGDEEGQQGQQQSRQGGGMQDQIKGLMNGDTSGVQGLMGSIGR
jgi:hypothetical protein